MSDPGTRTQAAAGGLVVALACSRRAGTRRAPPRRRPRGVGAREMRISEKSNINMLGVFISYYYEGLSSTSHYPPEMVTFRRSSAKVAGCRRMSPAKGTARSGQDANVGCSPAGRACKMTKMTAENAPRCQRPVGWR
jgi:hypothetical protein